MLGELKPAPGSRRPRRRKGRGIGSGHGRTCGRGQKGAGARSGHKKRPWFEGGQMPLARRLPKFGFRNVFRSPRQQVNLCDLARFDADVRKSQAQRRIVYEALRNGNYFPWDYQPLQQASERYMRNHMDLNVLEESQRFPSDD